MNVFKTARATATADAVMRKTTNTVRVDEVLQKRGEGGGEQEKRQEDKRRETRRRKKRKRGGCCVTGSVCVILTCVCRPVSRKKHEWKCREVCHILAAASDEVLASCH